MSMNEIAKSTKRKAQKVTHNCEKKPNRNLRRSYATALVAMAGYSYNNSVNMAIRTDFEFTSILRQNLRRSTKEHSATLILR